MRIDCETIPDSHPRLETSETVVIASQGTQACGDELVVTGTSEGGLKVHRIPRQEGTRW